MSLRGLHPGETVTIVGRGPSLLSLEASDVGPGPIITINHAILTVRNFGLPNVIYTMQKDGCIPHRSGALVPLGCRCPNPSRMVQPIEPETLIVSSAESSRCFRRYRHRIVVDVEQEFRLPWHTMSAPVAVRIAARMGATGVRMLGHDAYTRGDMRHVDTRGDAIELGDENYVSAGKRVARYAQRHGLAISWR